MPNRNIESRVRVAQPENNPNFWIILPPIRPEIISLSTETSKERYNHSTLLTDHSSEISDNLGIRPLK